MVKQDINIRAIFPNAVTMTALAFGVSSMNMALWGHWQLAILFILLSATFDFFDGKVARMLGVSSRFGAELDSLSDFVSFGVAPGFLMYQWTMNADIKIEVLKNEIARSEAIGIYWGFALFLAMCCATRLARFNAMLDEKQPSYWTHFFMGVPAPSGAGLAIFPIVLWLAFDKQIEFFRTPIFVGFFLIFSGVMMASKIPTLSLKHLHIPKKYASALIVISLLLMAGLFANPWATLSLFETGYILSIPVCIYYFLKFKKKSI
jgi:CDP-diacylglycerol--serine O-phosphatidyltransferase